MTRAVLSIGSNLGDRRAALQTVLDALGARVCAVSSVYRTPPWGGVAQDDFYNAAVIVDDPSLAAMDWLHLGRQCEHAAGRVRDLRWGPRTLDVDIVVCDDIVSDDPELTLPHPQARHRAFVLAPWLELEPDATLPVDGQPRPIRELLDELDPDEVRGVRREPAVALTPWESRA